MDVDNVVYIDHLSSSSECSSSSSSSSEDEAGRKKSGKKKEKKDRKKKLTFIPDIERELTRIPDYILNPDGNRDRNATSVATMAAAAVAAAKGMELVLYRDVPESVSDADEDGGSAAVRRAILESKRRWREEKEASRAAAAAAAGSAGANANANSFAGSGDGRQPVQLNRFGGQTAVANGYTGEPAMSPGPGGYGYDYDPDAMEIEL